MKGLQSKIRAFSRLEAQSRITRSPRQGPHEPALDEVLTALDLAGRGPSEVLLVGAIPELVETGAAMSARLRAAIPAAIDTLYTPAKMNER